MAKEHQSDDSWNDMSSWRKMFENIFGDWVARRGELVFEKDDGDIKNADVNKIFFEKLMEEECRHIYNSLSESLFVAIKHIDLLNKHIESLKGSVDIIKRNLKDPCALKDNEAMQQQVESLQEDIVGYKKELFRKLRFVYLVVQKLQRSGANETIPYQETLGKPTKESNNFLNEIQSLLEEFAQSGNNFTSNERENYKNKVESLIKKIIHTKSETVRKTFTRIKGVSEGTKKVGIYTKKNQGIISKVKNNNLDSKLKSSIQGDMNASPDSPNPES